MLERERPAVLALVYASIFAVMAAFTWLTPWCADDFSYSPKFLPSLLDILAAEKTQYLTWNGRSVAHFLLRVLILGTDGLGTFLLPLLFTGIIFFSLILLWGDAWRERTRWWHPLLLFALIWSFTPAFGQAFLWRTGAANYSLTSFFGLFFLVPYRLLLDTPTLRLRPLQVACVAVVALCAGWSNETVGPTVFMVACASVIQARVRSGCWSRWATLCCFLCLIGCLILLLAPGNYQRLLHPVFDAVRATPFAQRVAGFIFFLAKQQLFFLPLSLITGFGLWRVWKRNSQNRVLSFTREVLGTAPLAASIVFYAAAQCALGAFLFTPVTPPYRALTTASLFFCISAGGILIAQCLPRRAEHFFYVCVVLYYMANLINAGLIFYYQHEVVQERAHLFMISRSPILPPYYDIHGSRYFAPATLDDANVAWVRNAMMRYYNLNSLGIQEIFEESTLCQHVGKEQVTVGSGKRTVMIHLTAREASDLDTIDEIQVYYEGVPLSLREAARWLLHLMIAPFQHFWRDDLVRENWLAAYSDLSSTILQPGKKYSILTLHGRSTDIKFFSIGRKHSSKRLFIKADLTPCEAGDPHEF